jgi:hypothetical protein
MKKLIIFFFLANQVAWSQDFSFKRVELDGGNVNVYYDLLDSVAGRGYTIKLFSSRDNYVSPLEKVVGDAGLEVKPGGNKKITWAAKEELGANFEGEVGIEVRGRAYIPFVRLNGQYNSLKRLTPYNMTWSGGTQQNILNFDLYRKGKKVTTFPNIANVGHHKFTLPSNVKPGKGYSFKITDTKNQDQIVNTAPFKVKRKIPLLLKVLPMLAVGTLVANLLGKSSGASPSIPEAPGHP